MRFKDCTFQYQQYYGENDSITVTYPKVGDATPMMSVPINENNSDYVEIMKQVDAGELTIAPADE